MKKIFLYFFLLSLFEWLNLLHIFINDSFCMKVEDTFMWCSPFLQARFETTLLAPCCSATSLQIFYNKQVKFNDTLVDWMTSSDIDFGFWTWRSKNRKFCWFFCNFQVWNTGRSGTLPFIRNLKRSPSCAAIWTHRSCKAFQTETICLTMTESPNSNYIHNLKLANAISLNVISYNVAIFSKWINISN